MSDDHTTTEFEFDDSQNEVLGDLSGKMSFVGTLLMILGVLMLAVGAATLIAVGLEGIGSLGAGIVYFLIGFWTRNASASFKEIVNTEGQDITNLMNAMGQLRRLYTLQYWICLIAVILIVLGIVAGIVSGVSGG